MTSRPRPALARPDRLRRRQGFALLITIVLVAFLVLLLVGLATFTRVETQVAGNSQQLAAARQNALAALQIAVGELQKYAGPDQRATASAGLAPAATDGARHWTGVWGDTSDPQTSRSSTPAMLQWLVSGNERTAFDPATGVSTTAATFGQITGAPASWSFTPDTPVTGLTLAATVDSALTIGAANTRAVLLVGGNSASALGDYVVAPAVDLTAPAASIPGADATGPDVAIGRYAFWVGDEGVKARADLVDPYVLPTSGMSAAGLATAPTSPFRLMLPQRQAVEQLPDFASFPVNSTSLRQLLGIEQLGFVAPTISQDDREARFHDLTTSSAAVLADQRRGGLKRDLTFAFAQSLPNYRAALALPSATANPIVPVAEIPLSVQGPTWEQLHSYANLDGSSSLAPATQTATRHGVYPVLAQGRIGIGGQCIAAGAASRFELRIFPSFVLANPYNAPLAGATYHVRLDFGAASHLSTYIGNEPTAFWRKSLREMFEGQTFVLNCPDLAPGEARVFTLSTDNEPWAAVKSYQLEDEWSEFSIVHDTAADGGATFDETVINDYPDPSNPAVTLRAKGVHPVFGDSSAPASVTWASTFLGPRLASSNGGPDRGGTMSWTLVAPDNSIYQRVEIMGYSANPVSTYGIRGTAIQFSGASILRQADASAFTTTRALPYHAQYNWRAPLISRTGHYATQINGLGSWTQNFFQVPRNWIRLVNPGDPSDGRVEWNGAVGDTVSLPLARADWRPFDVPRAATGLVSLGQFQHVNTGGHNDGLAFPAAASPLASRPSTNGHWRPRYINPAHAIGNSRAHPHIAGDAVSASLSGQSYYDLSLLLNRELFDGYFFSTYPQSGAVDLASVRLANPRLRPFRSDLATTDTTAFRGGASFDAASVRLAARNLLLDGAFNVNSTSVQAWRALLYSLRGTSFNAETNLEAPFVRSIHQSAGSTNAAGGTHLDAWNGFRNLTNAQVDDLADKIVAQIRARGVALSLSDFINRELDSDTDLGHAGALQAAIDATSINSGFPTSIQVSASSTITIPEPEDTAPAGLFNYSDHTAKHALEGIAGWLTQADLVQALAPVLAARSDTFRIRTYGEALNPVTGASEGRAWCEAIVQRLPDYVDSADDATVAVGSLTQNDNRRFGRRFVIVGFRWLGREDI